MTDFIKKGYKDNSYNEGDFGKYGNFSIFDVGLLEVSIFWYCILQKLQYENTVKTIKIFSHNFVDEIPCCGKKNLFLFIIGFFFNIQEK